MLSHFIEEGSWQGFIQVEAATVTAPIIEMNKLRHRDLNDLSKLTQLGSEL